MRETLEGQLSEFLRQKRGGQTYAQFAKRLGITPSSLFRLENKRSGITLRLLKQILDRLKCKPSDVFKDW
jgi:transcriptional regulator with XRE-family HTH domain